MRFNAIFFRILFCKASKRDQFKGVHKEKKEQQMQNTNSQGTNTEKLQQDATDLKNHTQPMKSESEYEEGANDEIGEDARRSRKDAEEFQKHQGR